MPEHDPASPTVPQILAALVVGYLVYRFFIRASVPSTAAPARPPAVDPVRLAEKTATITGMFPQVSAAAVEAELLRNGGSIEIATERILAGGGLPEPPRAARAPAPVPAAQSRPPPQARPAARPPAPTGSRSGAGPSGARPVVEAGYPDLLTRYDLHHRLQEEEADGPSAESKGKGKAPATKDARMMAHREKRDSMIIEARRRVEKMIAEGKL